jgi:serine/threonine-protein kinase
MGGNVWQWCEDWYDSEQKYRVLRGASWSPSDRACLFSSYRNNLDPAESFDTHGFRCALAPAASSP